MSVSLTFPEICALRRVCSPEPGAWSGNAGHRQRPKFERGDVQQLGGQRGGNKEGTLIAVLRGSHPSMPNPPAC